MIRILFLLIVGLFIASSQAAPPNIVFILADDLGVNDLACYGRAEHKTPNLDRLAAEGMRFTSAYCAQPICSPSRAALLTGKTPARLHLTTYLPGRKDAPSQKLLHPKINQHLPLAEVTLAEHLRNRGYVSAAIGKWHLGGKGFLPPDQGFDYYHEGQANTTPSEHEGGKGEFDLTAQAERFIETNREKPFFLYLAHNSPHIRFTARTNLIAANARAFNPTYAALIQTLDESVGRLLRKIDELELRTNTIVIFTSDNGGLHVPEGPHQTITHNEPFRAGKGFLYEGGLRIPLIVRWPGNVPVAKVSDIPVVNTDWTPTLLRLAGGNPPENLDGRDIGPVLRGSAAAKEKERKFFWHFPHYTNQGSSPGGATREGEWKLIEHYDDGRVELFNLREDIGETRNVADVNHARVVRMREALAKWRVSVGAQTNTINPNFQAALHRPIYDEYDISTYRPARASAEEFQRVLNWRKLMNAALRY